MRVVFADVLAWFLFFGITVLGLGVTVLGTARTHRNARADGASEAGAAVLAAAIAVILFLGGWLFLGAYWLLDRLVGRLSRDSSPTA